MMPEGASQRPLPALRVDGAGARHIDYRKVLALGLPLFLNTGMQAVLSLTDTWFIAHISVAATAAMGATFFLVIAVILLFGGIGLAVQTIAAQSFGRGQYVRASRVTWMGLWGAALLTPLLCLVALAGDAILAPFQLDPDVHELAAAYWFPRIVGTPLSVSMWALAGFFNGIGNTRVTLAIAAAGAVCNVLFNAVFIFGLDLGIAGSAWATTVSLALANALALMAFLRPSLRPQFKPHLTWRPHLRPIASLFALGIPTGLFAAVDLIGISLFQLMQVKLGAIAGAVTQIVMMLTSTAFYPALGLAIAGTTLVGQSIGAGDRSWAFRVGNAAIKLAVAYMGAVGLFLGVFGEWLVARFVDVGDARAGELIHTGGILLWIAAAYQVFDALNMGSAFCLRGAGDVKVPTFMLVGLSWFCFVPLAHALSFAPGEGWVNFLPQFGLGVVGGWLAALVYVAALGMMLFWRWRSGAWRNIRLR